MDRKDIARRRLAEITDLDDRVALMLDAELGEELVVTLPILYEQGRCKLRTSNVPCQCFATDREPKQGMHLWLEIRCADKRTLEINFNGLMAQFPPGSAMHDLLQLMVGMIGIDDSARRR